MKVFFEGDAVELPRMEMRRKAVLRRVIIHENGKKIPLPPINLTPAKYDQEV